MHTYMFRTGEIVLKAETPEKLVVKEPYSLFLCDEKNFDVSVRFHYLHAFETPVGTLLKQTDSEDVYVTDDEYHFYYHVTGDRKYYAIRKIKKSLPSHHDVYVMQVFFTPHSLMQARVQCSLQLLAAQAKAHRRLCGKNTETPKQ